MSQTEAATANGTKTLPDGWRWVRLGEVIAEAQPGFACGERDPNGVIQLRMNNVDTRGTVVWDEFIRVPADDNLVERFRLVEGDVVFNNTNSTELVGKTALFTGYREPVVYSNHFTRLRVERNQADTRYVAAWILLQWQSRVFENICNRWIGQSAVKNDKLLAMEIPLPPLEEQQRIATTLEEQLASVERARVATEAQLEAAKALPSAYLRRVFDSPAAKRWPRKKLADVCDIVMGQSPDGTSYNEEGRGDPLLNGPTEFGVRHPTTVQWTTSPTRYAETGDILLCVRGATTGCKNIADKRYCIGRGLAAMRGKGSTAITDFLWFSLDVVTTKILSESSGSTFPNIPGEKLERIEISLPSHNDQQRIAAQLSAQMASVEQLRQGLTEQLDAISHLPSCILRRAFAGQL